MLNERLNININALCQVRQAEEIVEALVAVGDGPQP